jgi:hypothetical protein
VAKTLADYRTQVIIVIISFILQAPAYSKMKILFGKTNILAYSCLACVKCDQIGLNFDILATFSMPKSFFGEMESF